MIVFTLATRVQGSVQHLVYKKMLLLRSGGEKALGQVITFCTNEQERVFEAVHMGVLILGKITILFKHEFHFGYFLIFNKKRLSSLFCSIPLILSSNLKLINLYV